MKRVYFHGDLAEMTDSKRARTSGSVAFATARNPNRELLLGGAPKCAEMPLNFTREFCLYRLQATDGGVLRLEARTTFILFSERFPLLEWH